MHSRPEISTRHLGWEIPSSRGIFFRLGTNGLSFFRSIIAFLTMSKTLKISYRFWNSSKLSKISKELIYRHWNSRKLFSWLINKRTNFRWLCFIHNYTHKERKTNNVDIGINAAWKLFCWSNWGGELTVTMQCWFLCLHCLYL